MQLMHQLNPICIKCRIIIIIIIHHHNFMHRLQLNQHTRFESIFFSSFREEHPKSLLSSFIGKPFRCIIQHPLHRRLISCMAICWAHLRWLIWAMRLLGIQAPTMDYFQIAITIKAPNIFRWLAIWGWIEWNTRKHCTYTFHWFVFVLFCYLI